MLTVKTIYTNKKVPSKDTFQNRHYKTELFIVIRLLDTKVEGNVCIKFCFIKSVYKLYCNPLHLKKYNMHNCIQKEKALY